MTSEEAQWFKRIVDRCRDNVRLNPADTDAMYEMAHALQTLGQYEEAAKQFEIISCLEPSDHESIHALGQTLLKLGRLPEAIKQFEKSIELWPKEPGFYADLGDALIAAGQPDEAKRTYDTGLKLALPNEEVVDRIHRVLDRL